MLCLQSSSRMSYQRKPLRNIMGLMGLSLYLSLFFGSFVRGHELSETEVLINSPGENGNPILLEAEQLSFDEENRIVWASGSVQMSLLTANGVLFLKADDLTYNELTKVATARGNVVFFDKDGTAYKGDEIELAEDMSEGFIRALGMITKDNKRISAAQAIREGGHVTRFSNATYSSCNLCQQDPGKAPLWQLKALEVIRDEKAGDVDYYHAWLEMFGIPVIYAPFFSHADPTIKRRSGVLAPEMGGTSHMGFFMGVPYYGVISPSEDLTVMPVVMTKQYPLLDVEYRRQFDQGLWKTRGQITSSKQRMGGSSQLSASREVRGFIRTQADFKASDRPWQWGFDIFRASDRNYMRAYNIRDDDGSQPRTLDSSIYLQRLFKNPDGLLNARSFTRFDGWSFQSNTPGLSQKNMPLVLPRGVFSYRGTPTETGNAFFGDTSILGITRRDGANVARFSLEGGWQAPLDLGIGDQGTVFFSGRGDIYNVDHFRNRFTGQGVHKSIGRIFPRAGFDWHLPFINRGWAIPVLLDPRMSLQASPNGLNKGDIPNEDSSAFVLDADTLFFKQRGQGLDLIDSGQRASYGMDVSAFPKFLQKLSLFFGQSYALSKNPYGANAMGIYRGWSDYVAKTEIVFHDRFKLFSHMLLDRNKFFSKRTLLGTTFGPPVFQTTINYIQQIPFSEELFHQRQIQLMVSSKFTAHWSVYMDMTRNLKHPSGTLTNGFGFTYDDECFTFKAGYTRNFFHDDKTEAASIVLFSFNFKTLGEVSTGPLSSWAETRKQKAEKR